MRLAAGEAFGRALRALTRADLPLVRMRARGAALPFFASEISERTVLIRFRTCGAVERREDCTQVKRMQKAKFNATCQTAYVKPRCSIVLTVSCVDRCVV